MLANNFYKLCIDELGKEIIQNAMDFSEKVVGETYDRFNYELKRRKEAIFVGKISEEVFINFAKNVLNVELQSNYRIYEGTLNVDDYDFQINGKTIDIKSSRDSKNQGIDCCFNYFNFPVPTDQTIKDITLSIIFDNTIKDFYITTWIDLETYKKNCLIGKLPVGGGVYKDFYLYKIKNGRPLVEMKGYLNLLASNIH